MAQSDQTIQNATFPAVRADINDNLAALFSQSSGPSAPAVTVAYQPWVDTGASPAILKFRNGTNTGWITVGEIDTGSFAIGGVTPISSGGTGETTQSAAINALLPSQTGNATKALQTDGTNVSWEPVTTSQRFYYDASNTWTKPSTGTVALVTIWGGGGSGARSSSTPNISGGGGGACVQKLFYLFDLPSTVTITIGAGGTGKASNSSGSTGGTTTFGSLLSAYGGGGGSIGNLGAGGGGSKSAGVIGTGGAGHGPSLTGDSTDSTANPAGGTFGGGAGTNGPYIGGSSYWGGAGGGGVSSGGSVSSGGTSIHGGDGGSGAFSGNGISGSFPSGGGGACRNGTSGAGGGGLCIIYVW